MPADVYAKIEKKIVDLKQREDVWKKRYKDIAAEVQGLVDANSKQIKSMQDMLDRFDKRLTIDESTIKKNDSRIIEAFSGLDKKITSLSGNSKMLSEKADNLAKEMKSVKSDLTAQVNSAIARHEKIFDSTIKRIESAAERVHGETLKERDIYEKMEGAKKIMQDWKPPVQDSPFMISTIPEPPQMIYQEAPAIQKPAPQLKSPQSRPPAFQPFEKESPMPERLSIPPQPPRQPMMGVDQSGLGPPFVYDPNMQLSPPSVPTRGPPRVAVPYDPDLDDDLDMDDDIEDKGVGVVKNLDNSVQAMTSNVTGISEKLAAIEDAVSRISTQKNAGVDRLDDKIKMYSESVADMHNRMEMVERAMKDGLTPMMETMKMLTDTVKGLKRNGPGLPRPTPPRNEPKAPSSPSSAPPKRTKRSK